MENQKPLILFDFDGVFNPIAKTEQETPHLEGHINEIIKLPFGYGIFQDMPVNVDPTNISFFNNLVENENIEVQWFTTWQADTELFPEAIKTSPTSWLQGKESPGGLYLPKDQKIWWKLYTIYSLFQENPNRNILWIDDDINDDAPAVKWVNENSTVQIIVPNHIYGLTEQNRNQIRLFVNTHVN